jgi:hypothetical protein
MSPVPPDETWDDEQTLSAVSSHTSSRHLLLLLAREAHRSRGRLDHLEGTVDQMARRLKTAGSILATIVALSSAIGQYIPAWIATAVHAVQTEIGEKR